ARARPLASCARVSQAGSGVPSGTISAQHIVIEANEPIGVGPRAGQAQVARPRIPAEERNPLPDQMRNIQSSNVSGRPPPGNAGASKAWAIGRRHAMYNGLVRIVIGMDATSGTGDRRPNMTKPAFGVYVHWPFCLSKCPYCDFNSHVRHAAIDEARHVRAFTAEIATTAARVPGRTVSTIFFGGGTPSLMQPATVGAILDTIADHWTIAPDVEVTLEANPTSVEATRFRGYRAAGVNRVSLGVQALNDAELKTLGRLHTAQEALDAVAIARKAFERYSFDLIYARPGQMPRAWKG